jgi:hypothetical protein
VSLVRLRSGAIWFHSLGVILATSLLFAITHRSLGAWVMDDAGITYAYAIGLADHGSLSPLPESLAVEGYSNPLLFLLVAGLRWFNLFDPITTHAKIECALFSLMGLCVFHILRGRVTSTVAWLGSSLFVALELLTPSTWLWYRSGLENTTVALSMLTLFLLVDRRALDGASQRQSIIGSFVYGVIAFLASITRPEAPLYVAAFYLALVTCGQAPSANRHDNLIDTGRALAVTSGLYIGFLLWRHHFYGAWLPNTYYAKLGSGTRIASNIHMYIVRTIFPYGCSIGFALTAAVLACIPRYRRIAATLCLLMVTSLAMPTIAGRDWMGEHRFVTTFFALTHLSAALAVCLVATSWRQHRW